jgi:hypothetical protein
MKKLKLSIDGLKDRLELISSHELNAIIGGTYGGPSSDWGSNEGFLNNINGMISAGLFNYSGNNNFSGQYDTAFIGSGFSFFGSGSGTSSSSYNFSFGSTPNSNMFYFGSGSVNGSGVYQPGALYGNYGSGWGSVFTAPSFNPSLQVTAPDGRAINFSYDRSSGKFSFGITVNF